MSRKCNDLENTKKISRKIFKNPESRKGAFGCSILDKKHTSLLVSKKDHFNNPLSSISMEKKVKLDRVVLSENKKLHYYESECKTFFPKKEVDKMVKGIKAKDITCEHKEEFMRLKSKGMIGYISILERSLYEDYDVAKTSDYNIFNGKNRKIFTKIKIGKELGLSNKEIKHFNRDELIFKLLKKRNLIKEEYL